MRSGKSYFNMTLFKKTVLRWWPLWAAYLVLGIFIMPLNLMMSSMNGYYWSDFSHNMGDVIVVMGAVASVYAPVCALAVMSHIYWPRSANFYGALPVKREGVFITQYLAGFCFSLVPNIIVALMTMLAGALQGFTDMGALLLTLGVSTADMFFFYTFAIFCGMFAGHVLAMPVFYGVFNFVFVAVHWLVEHVLRNAYFGFNGLGQKVADVVNWLTPVFKATQIDWYYVEGSRWTHLRLEKESVAIVLAYTAAGVVLWVCAYLLYKHRRTESAGDVVAVAPMKPVFKYGVAVCSGMFLGCLTSETVLGDDTLPFTVVAWTVVGYFAAQMILDKSFRVFKKWRGALAVGLAMAAVVAAVELDITGFEDRVPDAGDVESMEIFSFHTSYGFGDSVDRFFGRDNSLTITDKEEIERVIELQKAAIKTRNSYTASPHGMVSIEFTYHLKTGSMSREYTFMVNEDEVDKEGTGAWALEKIFEDRELYAKIYGFDKLKAFMDIGGVPDVQYSYVSYYGEYEEVMDDPEQQYAYLTDGNYLRFPYFDDMKEILEAVKYDFEAGNLGLCHVGEKIDYNSYRYLHISYGPSSLMEAAEGWYTEMVVCIPPEAERTLSVIHRLLPKAMEEQGLYQKAGAHYYK